MNCHISLQTIWANVPIWDTIIIIICPLIIVSHYSISRGFLLYHLWASLYQERATEITFEKQKQIRERKFYLSLLSQLCPLPQIQQQQQIADFRFRNLYNLTLCHFGHSVAKAKLFSQKGFAPVAGMSVHITKLLARWRYESGTEPAHLCILTIIT